MSDSILSIIINTVKRGGGDKDAITGIVKLKNSFKELTGVNLSTVTSLAAVSTAMMAIVQFSKQAIQETMNYAAAVEKINRLTGISYEETSKLIQVSDDLRISEEALTQGLTYAVANGYEPTIDGIKEMADKYKSLPTGVDQARFSIEVFGKRAGPEMQKLLEKGGDGIQGLSDKISKNLILTSDIIRKTREYYQTVDDLEDAWMGVKITSGAALMSIVINTLDANKALNNTVALAHDLQDEYEKNGKYQYDWMGLSKKFYQENEQAIKSWKDESKTAAEIQVELKNKLDSVAASMKPLTRELLYQKAAAGLDAEAALSLARSMGMVDESAYRAVRSASEWKKQLDEGKISVEQYNSLVLSLGNSLGLIPRTIDVSIKVHADMGSSYLQALQSGVVTAEQLGIQSQSASTAQAVGGWTSTGVLEYAGKPYDPVKNRRKWINSSGGVKWMAEGGEFVVPPGYPDDSYTVKVQTGEHVRVTPAGQNIGGNTITLYVNGSGDPKAVANEVMRQLRLQGAL